MSDLSSLFWNASLDEIKTGYVYDQKSESYVCLICGVRYLDGLIIEIDDKFFEARKAVEIHIQQEHSSIFQYLVGLDKKYTGLTKHQINLLNYFYQGYSDKEIVQEIGGSTSTIRNYRFTFKEKEKQAKVTLAILELLKEGSQKEDGAKDEQFIDVHRTAPMVDERFAITKEEYDKIIKQYFKAGPEGELSSFPTKQKRKVVVLTNLIKRFETRRQYTEKEVNNILQEAYDDYVTLRRYLIEYGFMDRKPDCSAYWVKE